MNYLKIIIFILCISLCSTITNANNIDILKDDKGTININQKDKHFKQEVENEIKHEEDYNEINELMPSLETTQNKAKKQGLSQLSNIFPSKEKMNSYVSNLSFNKIIIIAIFNIIGLYYIRYSLKNANIIMAVAGVGLFIYPYFISSILLVILVGIGIALLPWGYSLIRN